jgi:hypothetical protein
LALEADDECSAFGTGPAPTVIVVVRVDGETRALYVGGELRQAAVSGELRRRAVPTESRTVVPQAETRIIK